MYTCIERLQKSFPFDTAELVSILPGRDSLCLTCSGLTLSHTRRLRPPSFVGKVQRCIVNNTPCIVLCSTICQQLLVLWLLRNVSTDNLKTIHAVPSSNLKDKVVPVQ
jgi:hypothetical protein